MNVFELGPGLWSRLPLPVLFIDNNALPLSDRHTLAFRTMRDRVTSFLSNKLPTVAFKIQTNLDGINKVARKWRNKRLS